MSGLPQETNRCDVACPWVSRFYRAIFKGVRHSSKTPFLKNRQVTQVERSPRALKASVGRSQGAFGSPVPELQPPFLPSPVFQGAATRLGVHDL